MSWEIWMPIYEMLFIKKKNPKMNTQSASINAKIFGTLLILSTFHIVEFLIACNETFTRSFSI